MTAKNRVRAFALLLGALVSLPGATAQGQATRPAVLTGKVTSEFGQPIEGAQVYLNEFSGYGAQTNAQGTYTITIPSARVLGQAVNLRVRSIGSQPGVRPIRVTEGSQEQNFTLKQDINRLSEVVVTGSVEATERSKVPFAIGRLTNEDIPVPALDPLRALEGKVAGVRVAQINGKPGTTPEIMMRGPKSINATGRNQGPLIIVDGVVAAGGLSELGGMDIESVEVIKGAAGASLFGTKAANGVITIKTKRGASQDGVKITARTEYGRSDLNSVHFGQAQEVPVMLDETGKRFCIAASSNLAPCSRTLDWMGEILRINNIKNAALPDTIRTSQTTQYAAPAPAGGELLNVYQASRYPGTTYNTFAQVSSRLPTSINSVDATGRMGAVRFFTSAQYQDERGAVKGFTGQQNRRGRMNLDYDLRSNFIISGSLMYNRSVNDNRGFAFGTLLRGASAATDYLARDSLGRLLVRGVGGGMKGTGNGQGALLFATENAFNQRQANRFVGNVTARYFPADWVTVEGLFAYDNRQRNDVSWVPKGYRTSGVSTSQNNGQQSIGNNTDEAYNSGLTATFRKQFNNDLSGKLQVAGLYDRTDATSNDGSGQQFVVKDIYTLSNTTTEKTATSSIQTDRNLGLSSGASLDYKGRYIVDATYRYDGSSRFGAGKRWAPFGRVSGIWRMSEESFWHSTRLSDVRLRASLGSAGNTPQFSAQYETYSCSLSGCSLGQAGNTQLKPETTHETELGADFTLFGRLGVEVTKADSRTTNQILNVGTPAALGFTTQWQNAGTLDNHTWEIAASLPVMNRRNFTWSMRATWDRTRTYITELNRPEYFFSANSGNGDGSFFYVSARSNFSTPDSARWQNGWELNRYGNMWGRKFYRSCGDLPESVQSRCGPDGTGKEFTIDDRGWVVWVGAGNSYKDGITKNLWQTRLPRADSPWNTVVSWGHPLVDRPLRGQPGEGTGSTEVLGNTLPDFRLTYSNNFQYKKLTVYGLLDGTFGHWINNQGEGWGVFDYASETFDTYGKSVETAKPVGYTWRSFEGGGTGGFYDQLGPNSYNVEKGSFMKLREVQVSYRVGQVKGMGDWTLGLVGRNLHTWTNYSGYDPETGTSGGQGGSGFVNQIDAFDYPTLRTYTFTISTRF